MPAARSGFVALDAGDFLQHVALKLIAGALDIGDQLFLVMPRGLSLPQEPL